MARITPLSRDAVSGLDEQFRLIEQIMGFLPNSLLTMARVPGLPEAMTGVARAVLMNDLIRPDLAQLVGHVASTAAGCRYCQAHTGNTAARLGVAEEKLAKVWEFETSELFDDAERAALRLALHAAGVPNSASDHDFEEAKKHYTEDELAAVVAVVAFFGFLNRWNDTVATELEGSPSTFGARVLASRGWDAGKHAASSSPAGADGGG